MREHEVLWGRSMGCFTLEISFERIQTPIDHGVVSAIINPCDKHAQLKPAIILYADEYPIGEMMEVGIVVDKYMEFIKPVFATLEVDVCKAELLNKNAVEELARRLGVRKFFTSKWGIIDLYIPTQVVEKHELSTFLDKVRVMSTHDNPYVQGLINYLNRVPGGKSILINTKIRCVVGRLHG